MSKRWLAAAALLAMAVPPPLQAVEPGRSILQLKHTRWTLADGLPGRVYSIAQTPDGFLWLGMSNGLYRFDGLRFEKIYAGDDVEEKEGPAVSLLVTRNGDLWVAFQLSGRFARYRGGRLQFLPSPPPQGIVVGLVEDTDGSVWGSVSAAAGKTIRFFNDRWQLIEPNAGLPPGQWSGMVVTPDGAMWIGYAEYVIRRARGETQFRRVHQSRGGSGRIFGDGAGRVWLMDQGAVRPLSGAGGQWPAPQTGSLPGFPDFRPGYPLFDHDGTLWMARRGEGLSRFSPTKRGNILDAHRVDAFTRVDGLPSNNLTAIFEDRQGSIWVSSTAGLSRFRATDFVAEPQLVKVAPYGDKLLGASDGSVYVAEADALYRILPGGGPEVIASDVLEPWGMCESPDGMVWLIETQGLRGFRDGRQQRRLPPVPSMQEGLYDCIADAQGTIWVGANDVGLYRWDGRGWTIEAGGPPAATALVSSSMGVVALNDEKNLYRRQVDGTWQVWHSRFALPMGTLPTFKSTATGIVVMADTGIAKVSEDRVTTVTSVPALRRTNGLVQTADGTSWIFGAAGLVRLPTAQFDRMFQQPGYLPTLRVFDFVDGLSERFSPYVLRSLVQGGDGRLWLATSAGTIWLNPARLHHNPAPPHVQITAIDGDGQRTANPGAVRLAAGTANVAIDFAVPNLAMPERVQVRYRLVGYDTGWTDPGTRRQAFYTRLPPGDYRFQVIAANESGIWNRTGATTAITIPPTFMQSRLFMVLCLAGAGLLAWLLHRLRLRQLAGQFQLRLKERLAERERIARELHDTLLQSVQGLVLKFQAVASRMGPADPLRGQLETELNGADAIILEARRRVYNLRSTSASMDLPSEAEELVCAAGFASDVTTRVSVVGDQRALNPSVAGDLHAILGEALFNAARHANATRVEVNIRYDKRALTIEVTDNGKGIDPSFAKGDVPEGHFGLIGMRERAHRIGGELTIAGGAPAGTRVSICLPATAAYATLDGAPKRWFPLWRRITP